MPTPHFTFRPTPQVLAAIGTIRALLSARSGHDVSKTDAIAFAVLRAAEELQAQAAAPEQSEPSAPTKEPAKAAAREPRPVAGIGGKLAREADTLAFVDDAVRRREESDRLANEARIKMMLAQPKKVMSLGGYNGPEGKYGAPPADGDTD